VKVDDGRQADPAEIVVGVAAEGFDGGLDGALGALRQGRDAGVI
jgi:hypothetical protein